MADSKTPYKLIGQNYQTPDLVAKVTGKARYAEDYRADGMVFVKLMLSPRPHARVTRIDASAALAMPGVHGILTADDMPPPPAPPGPPPAAPAARPAGAPAARCCGCCRAAGAPPAGSSGCRRRVRLPPARLPVRAGAQRPARCGSGRRPCGAARAVRRSRRKSR